LNSWIWFKALIGLIEIEKREKEKKMETSLVWVREEIEKRKKNN
jgi:hypothetical protein